MPTMTQAEWEAEGKRLFGDNQKAWRFKCPSCGHVASVADWKRVGATEGEVAFSCIGRHIEGARPAFDDTRPGPCTYAGGGLFRMNPVKVMTETGGITYVFAFAEKEVKPPTELRSEPGGETTASFRSEPTD